jgi:hypothetical protein
MLPLRASAFAGKKTVVVGDDDSGTYGGNLCMFQIQLVI